MESWDHVACNFRRQTLLAGRCIELHGQESSVSCIRFFICSDDVNLHVHVGLFVLAKHCYQLQGWIHGLLCCQPLFFMSCLFIIDLLIIT